MDLFGVTLDETLVSSIEFVVVPIGLGIFIIFLSVLFGLIAVYGFEKFFGVN